MPIRRHLLPEHSLVVVKVSGELDNNQLIRYIVEFERDFPKDELLKELFDLTEVSDASKLTVDGVMMSADIEKSKRRIRGGMTALVVPDQLMFGMARAFGCAAEDMRDEMNVFYHHDEAMDWLGLDRQVKDKVIQLLGKPCASSAITA